MNAKQKNNETHESTYALLVRSEEKERGLFETIAYGLFIVSAVAAIWQFANQPIDLPVDALHPTASTTQAVVAAHS